MEELILTKLNGIGPALAKTFGSIGIHTVHDLLHYFPRDYHDYSVIVPVASIKPGTVTIKAEIKQAAGRYARRGLHVTEAVASDDSGSVRLVWFNQPYRAGSLKPNQQYFITGKLEFRNSRYVIINPGIELVSDVPIHTARIVPVYRESKGVGTHLIRKTIAEAVKYLDTYTDVLPKPIIRTYDLYHYRDALHQLHFPESAETLKKAKRTMSFIEVFELMLASKLLKNEISAEIAPAIPFDQAIAKHFVESLPFKLTDAQRKCAWAILKDMEKPHPANRLVEGDVGAGKTVVAALAALMAMQSGYQVALLAPTEILARQHAESLVDMLQPVGYGKYVSLLTGSLKASQKKQVQERLASGDIRFIIGTHALLQGVVIPNLGLLIIDEQHRFGVEQRKELLKQTGKVPHVLSMTATPIPRSLALVLYGELDISLLDALPPGRKPIETKIVSPNSREPMENHIREELKSGRQAYVVCPTITEGKTESISAEATYKRLRTVFKEFRVGLLHGKLKSAEKQRLMEEFMTGKISLLVATTVIEVGVNVPNATIMVIEGADRFGLAQMHQLRGRVGRSNHQAYCYVVPSDTRAPSRRLLAFSQVSDGFRLAELDLELRGPGAIYGTLQHGQLDLRFANLQDAKLLAEARQAVADFLNKYDLTDYPELTRRVRVAQAVITLN